MYQQLKLENQLCFPLYAVSKKTTRMYKPLLDPLNLTYTQYIVLMVLWEKDGITVKSLGDHLYLDSGTLTPLLKKMESKGFLNRQRSKSDERTVEVYLTEKGNHLQEQAKDIPMKLVECLSLEEGELETLYKILYKLLDTDCVVDDVDEL